MRRSRTMPGVLVALSALTVLGCSDDILGTENPSEYQLTIVPEAVSVTPGQSVQLSVMLRDRQGNLFPHPASNEVAWRSSDSEIATVAAGMVVAISEGEVNITAGCKGQCAWATVDVGG